MSTIHYRNAKILIGGYHLSGSFAEFNVEYGSETLDQTAFGDTSRQFRGGLLTSRMGGRAHCEFGTGAIENVLFGLVGTDGLPVVAFPDGITVGSQSLAGFAMLGTIDTFDIGSAVGTLLPISFGVASNGIDP
jgi:hypothetical protein